MNEKEFYRQLMSEYSFDHEKIKKAAMGKIIGSEKKKSPMKWIASGCAAAVVAVTVGTVGIIAATSGGNPVTVTPTNSISVEDRFKLALEAYETADQNTEEVFLYVTFMKKETPTDMQDILARADGTGEIKVIEVYTDDNTSVSGSANIKELFNADEENIVAVKILCPGNFIKRLSRDRDVYLVETQAAFKDSSFSAIDTNVSAPEMPETSVSTTESSAPEDTPSSSSEQTSLPPVIGDTTPEKEEQAQTSVTTPQTEAPAPETESSSVPESTPNAESTAETTASPESIPETTIVTENAAETTATPDTESTTI
ncbi:MAG: hypothetical protein J6D27_01920 [Ruminiclostridium sp.]|nr:hypothetical protein [Ruminiclostridium sp.]